MKQITRDQWIQALRSGDYTQAHGSMRLLGEDGTRSHCCLAVVAELAGCEFEEQGSASFLVINPNNPTARRTTSSMLPDELLQSLELDKDRFDQDISQLVNMNDVARRSFEEIADVLELSAQEHISIRAARGRLFPSDI